MSLAVMEHPRTLDDPKRSRTKENRAIERRVEILGRLDDRHKTALAAGDRLALLELAAEYAVLGHGCPHLANQIVAEAEGL